MSQSPSEPPGHVRFPRINRDVWYAAFVAPTLGFLIWLAFDLYGELRDVQKKLGEKKADCAVIEDRQTTCVLAIDESGAGHCVFNKTRLKQPPP